MKKRVLVAVIVAALAFTVAPGTAQATGEGGTTAVVAVFTGNASVSPGLCAPADVGCIGPEIADYNLTIPGDPAPAPAVCQAAGQFETINAAGACTLLANGTVDGVATSKPTCNNTTGTSAGVNKVTFAGIERDHAHGWVTSAGATIPVSGRLDDADSDTTAGPNDHAIVSLVQAQPITAPGTIPCVTAPAGVFIIVGIAVVA